MTTDNLKEVVVTPEKATFWMDRWGNWCNRHGRFEHKKISAYFHAAVKRDAKGYYVSQVNGGVYEKVYFRYADTALFVFDLVGADPILLVLNTGRRLPLDPEALVMHRDALYVHEGDERIKFHQKSLLKISRYFEFEGEQCFLNVRGRRFPLTTEGDTAGQKIAEPGRQHGRSAQEPPRAPSSEAGGNP